MKKTDRASWQWFQTKRSQSDLIYSSASLWFTVSNDQAPLALPDVLNNKRFMDVADKLWQEAGQGFKSLHLDGYLTSLPFITPNARQRAGLAKNQHSCREEATQTHLSKQNQWKDPREACRRLAFPGQTAVTLEMGSARQVDSQSGSLPYGHKKNLCCSQGKRQIFYLWVRGCLSKLWLPGFEHAGREGRHYHPYLAKLTSLKMGGFLFCLGL